MKIIQNVRCPVVGHADVLAVRRAVLLASSVTRHRLSALARAEGVAIRGQRPG
jgi:hypothetical protein